MTSYLTIAEVAEALSVSPQTVRRRVWAGLLPALWLGTRLIRVEARSVHQDAPPPIPPWPATVGASELGEAWRMHPRTVQALATAGLLPGRRIGGQWAFRPADLDRIVRQLTTGTREAA